MFLNTTKLHINARGWVVGALASVDLHSLPAAFQKINIPKPVNHPRKIHIMVSHLISSAILNICCISGGAIVVCTDRNAPSLQGQGLHSPPPRPSPSSVTISHIHRLEIKDLGVKMLISAAKQAAGVTTLLWGLLSHGLRGSHFSLTECRQWIQLSTSTLCSHRAQSPISWQPRKAFPQGRLTFNSSSQYNTYMIQMHLTHSSKTLTF